MKTLGVLNGGDHPVADWMEWARQADLVVAADGALTRMLSAGLVPHEVIGDLDSSRPEDLQKVAKVVRLPDQSLSDVEKLVDHLLQRSASPVIAGIEGDRLDHVLFGLQCVAANPSVRILTRRMIGRSLAPGVFTFTPQSRLISLMPITTCVGVTLRGVKWELERARLEPTGLRSLSNQANSREPVQLQIESGHAILFTGWNGQVDWSYLA